MWMMETEEIIVMNRNNTGKASRNGMKWQELNQNQKDQLVSVMKDLFLAEVEKIGRPLHDAEKRRLMRMLGGELRKREIPIPLRGIYYALWNRMTRWNKKCFKTRDVYQEYHKHGNSKKFAAAHERELALHREAKKAFDALGLKKLPTIKSLSAEYEKLLGEKKRLYTEYRQVHEQMQEMLTVRANMEQMLKQDEAIREQERARANAR